METIIKEKFIFQSVYSNINRILSDAGALIESQHYASPHLRTVASHLEKAWKDFATGLDERTTVLALSVMFHQKAEQVNRHCFDVLYNNCKT
jgi:hypothetical protein